MCCLDCEGTVNQLLYDYCFDEFWVVCPKQYAHYESEAPSDDHEHEHQNVGWFW